MISVESSVRIDRKLDRKGTYGEEEILRIVRGRVWYVCWDLVLSQLHP